MSELTKKELNERLLLVETLLGLHRELPEQISLDKANDAIFRMQWTVSRGKEVAEPKLKQLDQSIFDGLDEKWRFAVIQNNGFALICTKLPFVAFGGSSWDWNGYSDVVGKGYDASNWQNSLIERKELTGSDLARAMLARGDKFVLCFVHEFGDDRAVEDKASVAINFVNEHGFQTDSNQYNNAVPINNQGEPLTASEAGL